MDTEFFIHTMKKKISKEERERLRKIGSKGGKQFWINKDRGERLVRMRALANKRWHQKKADTEEEYGA